MGTWLYLLQVYGFENLLFYGTFIITTVAFWTVSCGSSNIFQIHRLKMFRLPFSTSVWMSTDGFPPLGSTRFNQEQTNPLIKQKSGKNAL